MIGVGITLNNKFGKLTHKETQKIKEGDWLEFFQTFKGEISKKSLILTLETTGMVLSQLFKATMTEVNKK